MLCAVMSDSHDHLAHLEAAVEQVARRKADVLIHCGDFIAPFSLRVLDKAGIPVHGVFGNNDGDQYLLTRLSMGELENVTLHGQLGSLELDGRKIAFVHLPEVGRALAGAGGFDLVCFGHSHNHLARKVGDGWLLNPGEIMGKEERPGFCLYDTRAHRIERVDLPAA